MPEVSGRVNRLADEKEGRTGQADDGHTFTLGSGLTTWTDSSIVLLM